MPKAPILSNPAVLSALANYWHCQHDEPPLMHAATGRYLSPAEIMSLLLAAGGDPFRGCSALLTCSLLTGIPAADLRYTSWEDVDTEGCTLVTFSDTNGRFDCHTLMKPACLFLDRWAHNSVSHTGLAFELYGAQIEMDALADTLDVLSRLAGIAKLNFDDLVRSYDYIALVAALFDATPPALAASASDSTTPSPPEQGN